MLPVYLLISGKQFAEEAEVEVQLNKMDRWAPVVVVKLPIKMTILLFKLDVGRDR